MRRGLFSALLLVSVSFAAACGDDDDTAAGDLDRYCELSADLDERGEEVFENAPENADEIEVLRGFFEDNEELFDDLREAAPDEIKDDVETLFDANIDFIEGDESAGERAEPAEERIDSFEAESCPNGADG